MKAIILAAGRGKRMQSLTDDMPKPMLTVKGKTLLEHKIEALPEKVTDVILVVGYQKEKIIESIGDICCGKKVHYVHMEVLDGTASGVWVCRHLVDGPTLVLMGDDLYGKDDMEQAVEHNWYIGVQPAESPFVGGRVSVIDEQLQDVLEEGGEAGHLINTGMYVIGPELFTYEKVQLPNGEYGLPQTISQLARDIPVAAKMVQKWIRITAPEDLNAAEKLL